jgi:hypothetical protein
MIKNKHKTIFIYSYSFWFIDSLLFDSLLEFDYIIAEYNELFFIEHIIFQCFLACILIERNRILCKFSNGFQEVLIRTDNISCIHSCIDHLKQIHWSSWVEIIFINFLGVSILFLLFDNICDCFFTDLHAPRRVNA